MQLRALETSRAQLDYNQKRVQGGIGSRLNELRAAQVASSDAALLEVYRLNVRRAQEALGVLVVADGPVDAVDEPSFDLPADAAAIATTSAALGPALLQARPDLRLFSGQQQAAARVLRDSHETRHASALLVLPAH